MNLKQRWKSSEGGGWREDGEGGQTYYHGTCAEVRGQAYGASSLAYMQESNSGCQACSAIQTIKMMFIMYTISLYAYDFINKQYSHSISPQYVVLRNDNKVSQL